MYQGTWFVTIGTCLHNELDLAHGPNIYKDNKPLMSAFLKNLPVKVLGGRCLSV